MHFVDNDIELKSHCLQLDHTRSNLDLDLKEGLSARAAQACEDRPVTITDNGTNFVKAVELNHCTRFQWFEHILHLAIGK